MICELTSLKGQNLRQNLESLRFVVRCQHCGTLLFKTSISTNMCNSCHELVPNKLKLLLGFQPARFRYYNDDLITRGVDDK